MALAVSQDQRLWAYADGSLRTVEVLNWENQQSVMIAKTRYYDVLTDLLITPDNQKVITSWRPSLETNKQLPPLLMWDIKTGNPIPLLEEESSPVINLSMGGNADLLFVGELNGNGKLWNLTNNQLVKNFSAPNPILYSSFSLDDNYLFTWDTEKGRLWDLQAYPSTVNLPNTRNLSSTIKAGNYLLLNYQDSNNEYSKDLTDLEIFDTQTGNIVSTLRNTGTASTMALSPDGKYALLYGLSGFYFKIRKRQFQRGYTGIVLFDLVRNKIIEDWYDTQVFDFDNYSKMALNSEISPDGQWMAMTPYPGGSLVIYDLKNKREHMSYPMDEMPMNPSILFHDQGQHLWVSELNGTVSQIHVPSKIVLNSFPLADRLLTALAISPNGRLIAGCDETGKISIKEIANQALVTQIQVPEVGTQGFIQKILFSANGKYLISYKLMGKIEVWSIQSGKIIESFNGIHYGTEYNDDYSPDIGQLKTPFLERSESDNHFLYIDSTGKPVSQPCCVELSEILDWVKMLIDMEK